jgi:hypothetical protein
MVYLHIDSRNRDQTKYPFSNSFVVTLADPIKMITSAEIIAAKIPIGPTSENYLFVDIPELRSDQVRDAPELTATTTVDNVRTDTPSGKTMGHVIGVVPNDGVYYRPNSTTTVKVTYENPIEKLSRITVKVVDFTGTPVDIGTSNVTILLNLAISDQHMVYEREPLPEPVSRPVISKPAAQIPNKLLIIGLGIIALLFIIFVPKSKGLRRQQ